MKKVLILGVGAPQYDAILTLNRLGYETHAIAMKKDGPGADIAEYFSEINILDENRVVSYVKQNHINAIYSTGSDLSMPIASKISEKLGLPRFVTENTALICNNKNLMRQKLGKDFFGNIPYQILEDVDEEIELDYPFIMKPTDSQGQRGVNLINNHEEFLELFEQTKSYSRTGLVIIEYYVEGPELSVNGYVVNGEIQYLTASDRITWDDYVGLIHKHIVPANTISSTANKKLRNVMNELVKKLEIYNGPIYAQIKVENDTPYIIEVTPRLDGCHMWKVLEKFEGINLMDLTFKHLLENDYSDVEKYQEPISHYELEFICQEPNTKADYSHSQTVINDAEFSYLYYNNGDNIRPVNGKFEKIGYIINKI